MKKTLTAIAMAACLAMTPAAAFAAEETEANSSSVLLLQGIDELNNIWTVGLDAESQRGSVCLQLVNEEGEYPEEDNVLVFGSVVIGEDSMTITDDEDGLEYEFGMKDVEGTTDQVEMTYEPIGATVVLSVVDQNTVGDSGSEDMDFYAGFDEDGDQWTVGFDWTNSVIAIDIRNDEGSSAIAGTFEDDNNGTLTVTQEDGSTFNLGYEPVNEDYSSINLTTDAGLTVTVSYVNPTILDEAA